MRVVVSAFFIVSVTILPLLAEEKAVEGPASSQPTRSIATIAPQGSRDKAATPEEIVRAKWPATIAVLQDQDLDQAAKEKKIERLVSPLIDFPLMAKLALGKAHWTRLNPSQRERYVPLFIERIKRSYREKIALYEDEQVLIKFPPSGTITRKTRSSRTVHVPIELTTKGRQAVVLHKFRKVDKQWKLYDVEIEGVSILLTYRSQFTDILRTGTVEDLLAQLGKVPTR
jgi:phospholipid transport system substrate-binding protein